MSISSFHTEPYSSGQPAYASKPSTRAGLLASLSARWSEYRLLRQIESVPYDVMKDVGFPAAERANEM